MIPPFRCAPEHDVQSDRNLASAPFDRATFLFRRVANGRRYEVSESASAGYAQRKRSWYQTSLELPLSSQPSFRPRPKWNTYPLHCTFIMPSPIWRDPHHDKILSREAATTARGSELNAGAGNGAPTRRKNDRKRSRNTSTLKPSECCRISSGHHSCCSKRWIASAKCSGDCSSKKIPVAFSITVSTAPPAR